MCFFVLPQVAGTTVLDLGQNFKMACYIQVLGVLSNPPGEGVPEHTGRRPPVRSGTPAISGIGFPVPAAAEATEATEATAVVECIHNKIR